MKDDLKKICYILNLCFWIHFVGFTQKFSCVRKYSFVTCISLTFAMFNEINYAYIQYVIVRKHYEIDNSLHKKDLFILLFTTLESMQRFLLYFKRRKLNKLLHDTCRMYKSIIRDNDAKFTEKLLIVLFINELMGLGVITLFSLSLINEIFFSDPKEEFYYGFISPPYAQTCCYISIILSHWNLLTPTITIYFCCKCYMIKRILLEFKKRLSTGSGSNINSLFHMYTNITELVASINDFYQTLLVNTFSILMGLVFYESYILIFTVTDSNYLKVYRILNFSLHCLRFAFICLYSSAVTNIASDIKNMVYQLSVDITDWKILRFVLMASDTFVGFKILDSVIINKQLIVFAVGSIFTYCIMIASFSFKEEDDDH